MLVGSQKVMQGWLHLTKQNIHIMHTTFVHSCSVIVIVETVLCYFLFFFKFYSNVYNVYIVL